MTVVLITGNLINQFKCLITTASSRAEHEGSHFDADEIPERGRKEIKSSGDKGIPGEVLQGSPEDRGGGFLERTVVGLRQGAKIKAYPGPWLPIFVCPEVGPGVSNLWLMGHMTPGQPCM